MGKVTGLVCLKCGKRYEKGRHITCPDCGLDGILDVEYDYDDLRHSLKESPLQSRHVNNIFRYQDFLPLNQPPPGMLKVGMTPLYRFEKLADLTGVDEVYLKDDTVNPSSSLKDRASAVGIAMALEDGMDAIACASTGNAASSLAVLSASVGVDSYIFVPESAPEPKLYQIGACATRVFRVKGTYEDAFDVATAAIEKWGWYNRNCAINPYLVEGKKTCSLEIYEQLGYAVPDWLVVPVGDGCILSGQWKAFKDMRAAGLTDRSPRLLGVQAEGCSPVVECFLGKGEAYCADPQTIADSIRVGKPRNWRMALKALEESGGAAVTVSDEEIVSAIEVLGRHTGVFAEPAGSTAFAGLIRAAADGIIGKDERVVFLVTGSGLKDPESLKSRDLVTDIGHDISEVEEALASA
jgi:threonine synthase